MTSIETKFGTRISRRRLVEKRRTGFTFLEVLFAVILLGIGFIMIAGIFPVAIQQTATTAGETEGTLVARDAIRQIEAVASQPGASSLFPAVTTVTPLATNSGLATAIGTNGFFSADRRFAWVGFYLRNGTDPFVQLYVIVLQNSDFQQTNPAVYFNAGLPPPIPSNNTLTYSPYTAPGPTSPIVTQLAYSPSTGSSYAYVANPSAAAGDPVPNATTGAYLLVADNVGAATSSVAGRIYRLGASINPTQLPADVLPLWSSSPVSDVFQLEPGMDLKPPVPPATASPEQTTTAGSHVYILGRAPVNVTGSTTTANFTGPNQDIAAMSAVISINTANN